MCVTLSLHKKKTRRNMDKKSLWKCMCALHNALVISLWAICQPNHFCHVLWAKSRSRWWWWCCWSCCLLGPQAWNCRAWNYREFFDSYKRYMRSGCQLAAKLSRKVSYKICKFPINNTHKLQKQLSVHDMDTPSWKFLRRNDSCCNWYGYANSMY